MSELSEISWQYIAGFLDGEGSIIVGTTKGNNGDNRGVRIVFVNTNLKVLNYIDNFLKSKGISGVIAEKPQWRIKNGLHRKRCWHWRIGRRREVISLLTNLLPYLIIKRSKAIEALKLANRPDPRIGTHPSLESRRKHSQSLRAWWARRKELVKSG